MVLQSRLSSKNKGGWVLSEKDQPPENVGDSNSFELINGKQRRISPRPIIPADPPVQEQGRSLLCLDTRRGEAPQHPVRQRRVTVARASPAETMSRVSAPESSHRPCVSGRKWYMPIDRAFAS